MPVNLVDIFNLLQTKKVKLAIGQATYVTMHPEIVRNSGIEEAVVLAKMHQMQKDSTKTYLCKDGNKYCVSGYKELIEELPFYSVRRLRRIIVYLEAKGWIKASRFHSLKRGIGFADKMPQFHEDNQRKWYCMDYAQILTDTGLDLRQEE